LLDIEESTAGDLGETTSGLSCFNSEGVELVPAA